MKYMIGVDAGTSNVKAVLFDEEGMEIAAETIENEPIHIGGSHVEMDMNTLWNKTVSCLKNVIASSGVDKREIAGIGVTGQGEGCWLIDGNGKPVQNAILWCDARANEEVRHVREAHPEIAERMFKATGTPPVTSTQLIQLLWMKNNRKEVLDRAKTVFFCKDWLRYQLTGVISTDMTDAGTCYVDVNTGTISAELFELLGLGAYISYIPEPAASDEIAARLKDEVADALSLPQGTPVIAGSIDVCAACVGTGAIHENDICIVLGTTCANMIVKNKADCGFGAEGTRYEKYPIGDLYFLLQPTMNGTPNIDWMLGAIAQTRDFAAIDHIIESVPVGCGGVVYSPYISVAGERAPFYHPYARANFFGISQTTKRETLVRAVYEGIAMSIRDCLPDISQGGKIFLAGGGAKSAAWSQMIADCMGVPVYITDAKELGAKGVALMTGVRLGVYKDYDAAVNRACRFSQVFEPMAKNTEKYDLVYELYRQIREVNVPLWHLRHQITKKLKIM